MSVSRRDFLQCAATGVGAMAAAMSTQAAAEIARSDGGVFGPSARSATLEFVPRLGQFVHHAPHGVADEVRFLAEQGFSTVDDPLFTRRSADERRRLADATARVGLRLGICEGVIELRGPTFAARSASNRAAACAAVRNAVQAVADAGGRFCVVVPGRCDADSSRRDQWSRAVDALRRAADVAAARQVTLLIEPLDADDPARRRGTPMLVPSLERAAALCRDIDSPYCRAMVDVYRWSTSRGGARPLAELLTVLEADWNQWGAVRIAVAPDGHEPGGHEPGAGTLELHQLLAFLADRGFAGPIGMAHGAANPGLDGERTVLQAYANLRRTPAAARSSRGGLPRYENA